MLYARSFQNYAAATAASATVVMLAMLERLAREVRSYLRLGWLRASHTMWQCCTINLGISIVLSVRVYFTNDARRGSCSPREE